MDGYLLMDASLRRLGQLPMLQIPSMSIWHRATAPVALVMLASCGASQTASGPARQAEAEYDMAREVFYRGDWRVSLDHARRSVVLDPQNAKALYFVSVVHAAFCLGDEGLSAPDCKIGEAEAFARRSVEADAKLKDAKNLLGQILILRGQYKEAMTVLKPLTEDPSYIASHLAWGNYGWAQVQLGDLDGAIHSLTQAVVQPKFCVGYFRLGVAYAKKSDLAHADQSFTRALDVDSPDCKAMQQAWQSRGEVREKAQDLRGALSDFKRCTDLGAKTPSGTACSARAVGLRARVTTEAS